MSGSKKQHNTKYHNNEIQSHFEDNICLLVPNRNHVLRPFFVCFWCTMPELFFADVATCEFFENTITIRTCPKHHEIESNPHICKPNRNISFCAMDVVNFEQGMRSGKIFLWDYHLPCKSIANWECDHLPSTRGTVWTRWQNSAICRFCNHLNSGDRNQIWWQCWLGWYFAKDWLSFNVKCNLRKWNKQTVHTFLGLLAWVVHSDMFSPKWNFRFVEQRTPTNPWRQTIFFRDLVLKQVPIKKSLVQDYARPTV